ncbi:MAG: hypothetical protein HY423_09170 [Candidatus Lambdaproteobacteria bacterium]|nr:hypothetical protein [Candidatus Lambdaproteobacteria bacterium]
MVHPIPLPSPVTLSALQQYVRAVVSARNFTTDLNKVFILLVEEVGELSGELRLAPAASDPAYRRALAFEAVDVLLYALDVANGLGLDLDAGNGGEGYDSRRRPPPPALGERVAGAPVAAPEQLAHRLWAAAGELATALRRHWKRKLDPAEAVLRVVALVDAVLAVCHSYGLDLEAALAEKERLNATRNWSY